MSFFKHEGVTLDELDELAKLAAVKAAFNVKKDPRFGGVKLALAADVAVVRGVKGYGARHGGDYFFMFDADAARPVVAVHVDSGTGNWIDLTA